MLLDVLFPAVPTTVESIGGTADLLPLLPAPLLLLLALAAPMAAMASATAALSTEASCAASFLEAPLLGTVSTSWPCRLQALVPLHTPHSSTCSTVAHPDVNTVLTLHMQLGMSPKWKHHSKPRCAGAPMSTCTEPLAAYQMHSPPLDPTSAACAVHKEPASSLSGQHACSNPAMPARLQCTALRPPIMQQAGTRQTPHAASSASPGPCSTGQARPACRCSTC